MSSTAPGRRERKKRATRLHIAQTAIGLFLERGFDAVSVAEIAEAADVSKVTVFNYFPAKADMVFELADARSIRPAAVVRDRAAGQSALEAIRDYYVAGLDGHAEWTGLHDGVEEYVAMVWASPTLLSAFARRRHAAAEELAAELARAVGEEPVAIGPFREPAGERAPGAITHRVVAGMIMGAIEQLINANVARMIAGQSAAEAEPQARADAEAAFAMLAGGIAGYARRARDRP